MSQNVSLRFINDQDWFLALDVSRLAAFYDLTTGVFRMQARRVLGQAAVDYAWSSTSGPNGDGAPGDITYDLSSNLLLITAPYSDMRYLRAGTYSYGLHYERDVPMYRYVVMDVWVGTLTVEQGVVYT